MCIKFVSLLSQTTGLEISIRVGAVAKGEQAGGVSRFLRERQPGEKEVREQGEEFGPVPREWPESLRRIFTGAEGSGGRRRCREETSNAAPGDHDGPQTDESSREAARPSKSPEKSGSKDDDKTEKAAQPDGEGDDDDFQMISGYKFYHPDIPYPSIESVSDRRSQRTATTPEGSPLPVSPRTDMYIRGRRYDGPTYMPPRERSYIRKPVATPITTTPSDIRRRFPASYTVAGNKRKRGGNDIEEDGARSKKRSKVGSKTQSGVRGLR